MTYTFSGQVTDSTGSAVEGAEVVVLDDGASQIGTSAANAYDISTASLEKNHDISGQDGSVRDVAWNNDGTKMYIVGADNDNVSEYNVSTSFDIGTATFSQSFDISDQTTNPFGLAFNDDGSKMYILNDSVYEYNLNTPFDISSATFSQSTDVSADVDFTTGLTFNNDGTKLYVTDGDDNSVKEYDLSTAYDVSTASLLQSNVITTDFDLRTMEWNNDGTKLYGGFTELFADGYVYEFDLSTAFDISTTSFNQSLDLSGDTRIVEGLSWNDIGSKLYVTDDAENLILQYNAGTEEKTVDTTDANGDYSILVGENKDHHIAVQYEDSSTSETFNSVSKPFVTSDQERTSLNFELSNSYTTPSQDAADFDFGGSGYIVRTSSTGVRITSSTGVVRTNR